MTTYGMKELREYVMAPTGQNRSESTVLIHVSHSNLQAKFFELRLDLHMTIDSLKVKLSTHVGTNPSAQILQLLDDQGNLLCGTMEDGRKLGYYSPHDGCSIHVIDTDPQSMSVGGWLENTDLVDKYMMSDTEYDKRENTFRSWKQGKLKEDPTWTLQKEIAKNKGEAPPPVKEVTTDADAFVSDAASVTVGGRVSVEPGDRRGEVKFVGRDVSGLPLGWWVGVAYDEPLGRNDGTVGGKRLFTCSPGYGGMVRPDKVTVGDFPPLDGGLSDELGSEDEI